MICRGLVELLTAERIQIIRPQKNLVLYKSFNTLWRGGRNLWQIFPAMGTYSSAHPLPLPLPSPSPHPPTLKPRISPINRNLLLLDALTGLTIVCTVNNRATAVVVHLNTVNIEIMWTYHRMQSWFAKYFRIVWLSGHPTFCSCDKNLKNGKGLWGKWF